MAKRLRVSEEADVKSREKDLQNAETSLDLALRDIMGTGHGRAWVWDLLGKCHLFSTPMCADDRGTAFSCGEQNIGIQVMAQVMRVCPDLYATAMREAKDE